MATSNRGRKPAQEKRDKAKAARQRKTARAPAPRRKPPVKAFKARSTPKARGQARKRAVRPTCPICSSRDVEVAQPKGKGKAEAKPAAGVVLPFIVERHGGLTCRSCGYRQEAVL